MTALSAAMAAALQRMQTPPAWIEIPAEAPGPKIIPLATYNPEEWL